MPQKVYANAMLGRVSLFDIAVFLASGPEAGVKVDPEQADVALYLSPVLAKQMHQLLGVLVEAYESMTGQPVPMELNPERAEQALAAAQQNHTNAHLKVETHGGTKSVSRG